MATNSTVFHFSRNGLQTPGVHSPADLNECPPGWKQTDLPGLTFHFTRCPASLEQGRLEFI